MVRVAESLPDGSCVSITLREGISRLSGCTMIVRRLNVCQSSRALAGCIENLESPGSNAEEISLPVNATLGRDPEGGEVPATLLTLTPSSVLCLGRHCTTL